MVIVADNKRNTVVALFVLFGIFGVGVVLSARWLMGDGMLPAGDRVAVIPLKGPIVSEDAFLAVLDRFRDDRSVRAFVIEIESPGGAVGASQAIYEAIRQLRDEGDRPVIGWMGDVAASGGYYAAMGTDSVFALPGTITGSIGVIMEFPNLEELYRKIGIGWEVVKSGVHKDMGSSSHPLSESDRQILQSLVQDVHDQFVDDVAANRPLDRATVESLADGRVYSGRQARDLGLIDGLMTLKEAIGRAGQMAGLGSDPDVVRPPERRIGLWDLIRGVTETEARGLLGTLVPLRSGTPRLLYEWR